RDFSHCCGQGRAHFGSGTRGVKFWFEEFSPQTAPPSEGGEGAICWRWDSVETHSTGAPPGVTAAKGARAAGPQSVRTFSVQPGQAGREPGRNPVRRSTGRGDGGFSRRLRAGQWRR